MTRKEEAIVRGGEVPAEVVSVLPVKKSRWLARIAYLAAWSPIVAVGASTTASLACGELQPEASLVCETNDRFQHSVTDGIASLIGKLPGMPDIAPTEPALDPNRRVVS